MRTLIATSVMLGAVAAASGNLGQPDVPDPGQSFIAPMASVWMYPLKPWALRQPSFKHCRFLRKGEKPW